MVRHARLRQLPLPEQGGASGDWFVAGPAARKAYVSLYASVDCDRADLAQSYRGRLPQGGIGRPCVRIKRLSASISGWSRGSYGGRGRGNRPPYRV